MATYDDWTEIREYRMWAAEDMWTVVSVDRHRNGRVRVYQDSELVSCTTSLNEAYRDAHDIARKAASEAEATCGCGEDAMVCGSSYSEPHAVRLQIVDVVENRTLEPDEL